MDITPKDNTKMGIGITAMVSLTALTLILAYLGYYSQVIAYATTVVIVTITGYYFKSIRDLENQKLSLQKYDRVLSAIEKLPLPKKYDKIIDTVIEGLRKEEVPEAKVEELLSATKKGEKSPKKEGQKQVKSRD